MGFGKHNDQINKAEFASLLLVSNAAGFASILAACWSKTSFAMTLLRITQGWTRVFVWFVIITINLTLGMTATIQWAQCTPVEKIWISDMKGKCLPRMLLIQLNTFAAGKSQLDPDTRSRTDRGSLFWCHGCRFGSFTVENYLARFHQQKGKDWCSICHEYGCFVSFLAKSTPSAHHQS